MESLLWIEARDAGYGFWQKMFGSGIRMVLRPEYTSWFRRSLEWDSGSV